MSANTEIKIAAGRTYRTRGDRRLHVIAVEGWRVTFVVVSDFGFGERQTSSYVDFAKSIAEDVTP